MRGVGDVVRVDPVPGWGGEPLDVYRGVVCAGQVGHEGAGRARHVRDQGELLAGGALVLPCECFQPEAVVTE